MNRKAIRNENDIEARLTTSLPCLEKCQSIIIGTITTTIQKKNSLQSTLSLDTSNLRLKAVLQMRHRDDERVDGFGESSLRCGVLGRLHLEFNGRFERMRHPIPRECDLWVVEQFTEAVHRDIAVVSQRLSISQLAVVLSTEILESSWYSQRFRSHSRITDMQ